MTLLVMRLNNRIFFLQTGFASDPFASFQPSNNRKLLGSIFRISIFIFNLNFILVFSFPEKSDPFADDVGVSKSSAQVLFSSSTRLECLQVINCQDFPIVC